MAKRYSISPEWNKDTLKAKNGVVPNIQNNTFGSQANTWIELKDMFYRSANSGVVFEKPIITVKDINMPYATPDEAFAGAVLDFDGNIHFVPARASYGLKMTQDGVTSTYALVRVPATNENFALYAGGVLAPNGSIHFIPYANGAVGQKVNPNGTVSTYSLILPSGQATNEFLYNGGVLGPDGKIYVVPSRASFGLVIDPTTDTCSTYSLVFSGSATTYKHSGGVMASDGTIHFVNAAGNIGQKIKVNELGITVSTYSLINTVDPNISNTEYGGGVLALDGTIHFVPFRAPVGQKINPNGSLSTYSLPYTNIFGAYNRGVLALDGSIHFIPYAANIGMKINPNGSVSTYNLAYTSSTHYNIGGILKYDGTIDVIPSGTIINGTNKLQNINIGVGYNLPPAACVSTLYNNC